MLVCGFTGIFPSMLLSNCLDRQRAGASSGHDEVDRLQVQVPRSEQVGLSGFGPKDLRWMAGYQSMAAIPMNDWDRHSGGIARQGHKVSVHHLYICWCCDYHRLQSTVYEKHNSQSQNQGHENICPAKSFHPTAEMMLQRYPLRSAPFSTSTT